MKEIEKLILQKVVIELRLAQAKMQYGNKYVFGSDDVFITLNRMITDLND